jgi:hypothetical protein
MIISIEHHRLSKKARHFWTSSAEKKNEVLALEKAIIDREDDEDLEAFLEEIGWNTPISLVDDEHDERRQDLKKLNKWGHG